MKLCNNQQAFLELVRAGLWEKEACLLQYGNIDFQEIYRLAQEQSVVGLVAAGFEHVKDVKIPQEYALSVAGETLQLEQRNIAMNKFIGVLVDKMRKADIYALLVKGQGIAQCYDRPFWRACGDMDFLLSDSNYIKAKEFLTPLANEVDVEDAYEQHLGLIINPWLVEIHGNLYTAISSEIDRGLKSIQEDVFYGGNVRTWMNGDTQVFMPGVNNDICFVFTHILKHFFKGELGLRQICDLCRLLWTYRDTINLKQLESRLLEMEITSEWKSFASLAVEYLGMPYNTMPFYSVENKWKTKAARIMTLVFEKGNMGHNRDMSYQQRYTSTRRRLTTFGIMVKDFSRLFLIFPKDSIKALWHRTLKGINSFFNGKK